MEFKEIALALIIIALLLPIIITTALTSPILPAKPTEGTYSVDFSFVSSYKLYWLNYEKTRYEIWVTDFSLTAEKSTPVVLAIMPEPYARPLVIPVLGVSYISVPVRLAIKVYEGSSQVAYKSMDINLQFPYSAPHGYEVLYNATFSLLLKPGTYTIILSIENALFGGYLTSLTYSFELFENGSFSQPDLLTPITEQEPPPEPTPTQPEPKEYTLEITATGPGTTDPNPGTYTFREGTKVTIKAIPDENAKLKEWIIDGEYKLYNTEISIIMNANHTVVAYFEEVEPQPPPEERGTIYIRTYLGRGSNDGVWMTKAGKPDLGTVPESRPTDLRGHKAHVIIKSTSGDVLAELDTDDSGSASVEIPKAPLLSLRIEARFKAFDKELKVSGLIEASSAYFGGTIHIAKALPDAKLIVSLARYKDGRYVAFDPTVRIQLELRRYGIKIDSETTSSSTYFPKVTLSIPFYQLPGKFSVKGVYGCYVAESGDVILPDPWSADSVGIVFVETPIPEREFPINVKVGYILARSTVVLPDGSIQYVRSFVRINYQVYGSEDWYFDYEAYTKDDGSYVIIPVEACGKYLSPWPFETWRTKYGVRIVYAWGRYEHYEELVVEPDRQYKVDAVWEQKPVSTLAFIGIGVVNIAWLTVSFVVAVIVLLIIRRLIY